MIIQLSLHGYNVQRAGSEDTIRKTVHKRGVGVGGYFEQVAAAQLYNAGQKQNEPIKSKWSVVSAKRTL